MLIEKGHFSSYRNKYQRLSESVRFDRIEFGKVNVFISHKHDDLEQIKDILAFLSTEYGVNPYIDSWDIAMPEVTSKKTAERIKKKITECDKFLLLATEGAIASKWCNWELGYGDAQKFANDSIALFPLKEKGYSDSSYKGNEYFALYPYIVYEDGTRKYTSGNRIEKGYYVRNQKEDGSGSLEPLDTWLRRKSR